MIRKGPLTWVELRGFEPLASSLRTKRATNCATAPGLPCDRETLTRRWSLSETGSVAYCSTDLLLFDRRRSGLGYCGGRLGLGVRGTG